jgi:hypothetical protein
MKNKSSTQEWPQGKDTPWPDQSSQSSNFSLHREYANEGDEFLDDAIRTGDQAFGQIDGTFEEWKIRSTRASNIAK